MWVYVLERERERSSEKKGIGEDDEGDDEERERSATITRAENTEERKVVIAFFLSHTHSFHCSHSALFWPPTSQKL